MGTGPILLCAFYLIESKSAPLPEHLQLCLVAEIKSQVNALLRIFNQIEKQEFPLGCSGRVSILVLIFPFNHRRKI